MSSLGLTERISKFRSVSLFSDGVVMTNLLPSKHPLEHLLIFNIARGRIAIEMIKSYSHTTGSLPVSLIATSMWCILLLPGWASRRVQDNEVKIALKNFLCYMLQFYCCMVWTAISLRICRHAHVEFYLPILILMLSVQQISDKLHGILFRIYDNFLSIYKFLCCWVSSPSLSLSLFSSI